MQYCIFPVYVHLRQQNTQCRVAHSLHGMYICCGTYLCTCCITLTWFDKLINSEVDNKTRRSVYDTVWSRSLVQFPVCSPVAATSMEASTPVPSWAQCGAACRGIRHWALEESGSRLRLLDRAQSEALTQIFNTSSLSLNYLDFSCAPKMPVSQKPKGYS